jgi:hypothetical protein
MSWLKWSSTCIASQGPKFKLQYHKKKKKKKKKKFNNLNEKFSKDIEILGKEKNRSWKQNLKKSNFKTQWTALPIDQAKGRIAGIEDQLKESLYSDRMTK